MVLSRLIPIIPNIDTPQSTHHTTTSRSSGHSNSAYSFDVVKPVIKVTTANKIVIKYNTTFLEIYDVGFPEGYIFEGKDVVIPDKMIEPGYILVGITLLGLTPGVTVPADQESILVRLYCSINKTGVTYLTIATKDQPVKVGMYERYTFFMNSQLEKIEITPSNTDIGTCAVSLGVAMPPHTAFEITPTEPLVYETTIFNASKSLDPDGYIRYYYWEIVRGDSYDIVNTTNPVVYYNFTYPGTYNVTLQVVDDDNLTSSASQEIKVNYIPDPFDISDLFPFITVILVVSVTFVVLYVVIRVKSGQRFKE